MVKDERPFVILIDTNAMAALSLYVQSCTTVKAVLGTTVDDLKSKFREVKNTKDTLLYFKGRGGIIDGYKLFNHLKSKIKNSDNIQVWFSLLSEIELLDVFLDRAFDIELTRKGIPYRIRRKQPFRVQIDFDYEGEIVKTWEDLKEKLSEQGIEFYFPEKENDAIQDIIKIAKIVTRHVALEPVDLYLYALGIYLRADEIFTHDVEFKKTINSLISDGDWRNIYNNIQKGLIENIQSFKEEFEKNCKIELPKGVP